MSQRTVWKYKLRPGLNVIHVPSGSRVVKIAPWTPESDGPAAWIERPREGDADRIIHLVGIGSGDDVPERGAHLGSAWCGPYMWHVYELALP